MKVIGRYEILGVQLHTPRKHSSLMSMFSPRGREEDDWKKPEDKPEEIGLLVMRPEGSEDNSDSIALPIPRDEVGQYRVGQVFTLELGSMDA